MDKTKYPTAFQKGVWHESEYNGLEIACGCFGTQASVGAKSISISSALAISCVIALVWNGRSVKQISGRSFY